MNKLRSDSAFCQLTSEQVKAVDNWLFEERLGYPAVLEKVKVQFGLETSLSGVRRFYKRLEMERSRLSVMDIAEMSATVREAMKGAPLKPGLMLLANKCAFELMMQPREEWCVRELTGLMRAITSAEADARKQTDFDRQEKRREDVIKDREWRESWRMTAADLEEEKEELRQERAARKKAKLEAKAAEVNKNAGTQKATSPRPSPPEAEREKERSKVAQSKAENGRASIFAARPLTPTLSPDGGEGEESAAVVAGGGAGEADVAELGGRGGGAQNRGPEEGTVTKESDESWHPSVVEEQEDAENYAAEAAENHLTPLNAA